MRRSPLSRMSHQVSSRGAVTLKSAVEGAKDCCVDIGSGRLGPTGAKLLALVLHEAAPPLLTSLDLRPGSVDTLARLHC